MKFSSLFKKKTVKSVLKFVLKYIIPILTGWIEGDSHVLSDALKSLVDILL